MYDDYSIIHMRVHLAFLIFKDYINATWILVLQVINLGRFEQKEINLLHLGTLTILKLVEYLI